MLRSTVSVLALAMLVACSQAPGKNFVRGVTLSAAGLRPAVLTATAPTVNVTLTLDLETVLNTEYLYGADLQYSSFYDADMDLYNQSLAIGHIPARFRIAGDELQLVSDNRRLFPSEVNHPEQLLSRMKIVARTETSLVVAALDSRVLLGEIFEGTHSDTKGGFTNPQGAIPKDHWVRGLEFVAQGSYLLQQTSIVLQDGSIAEFMESVFPRATLSPGADFEKFQMDPENPIGGDDGVVARFRLLPGEVNFTHDNDGETKLAMATHYDISAGGNIDWYVTANIPDESLAPVAQAVEGWNRYFKHMKGIERDVMRFKGRLPEGLHLGDPRFNVINWDSRLIAGAAYESQAYDPATGRQSHSLIYMPAAWLKIGTDYWTNGRFSDAPAEGLHKGVACARDVRAASALAFSGRLASDEVKTFGVELLKQTLFHEVGHALGLAHNFKGSLSLDRSKPGAMFSTSIMDYNDFEIERGAFTSVDSAEGPELEYDRQAMDAIYNHSRDIAESDEVVPVCNDAEADAEDGGVDPLCIRYDLESDPSLAVNTALARITQAELAGDVTLAQALKRVPTLVLAGDPVAAARSKAEVDALVSRLKAGLTGSMSFYVTGGKASVSRTVRTAVKLLLTYADGALPETFDELAMRERSIEGVRKALALNALPEAAAAGLAEAVDAAISLVDETPYAQSLDKVARDALLTQARKLLSSVGAAYATGPSGLPKLRAAVFATLTRHEAVPYFFGTLGEAKLDFENELVGLLAEAISDSALRTEAERKAAAASLVTYRGRLAGDLAISAAISKLTAERALATDNASREIAEAVLAVLRSKAL